MPKVSLPQSGREISVDIETKEGKVVGVSVQFDKSVPPSTVAEYADKLHRSLNASSYARSLRFFNLGISMAPQDLGTRLTEWTSGLDQKLVADNQTLNAVLASLRAPKVPKSRAKKPAKPGKKTLKAVFDLLVTEEDVVKASRALFVDGHYPSAVFEAFKVVNITAKQSSGLSKDGKDLMFAAFHPDTGALKINTGTSQSERDEREGFMHIYAGAMQGIRNPKGHDVVIQEDPKRALQYLALASLLVARAKEAQKAAIEGG